MRGHYKRGVISGSVLTRHVHKVNGKQNIQVSDAAKAEIGKCYGVLMNGYQKGDWKVTSQIYGPNCTILSPGQPTIKGREGKKNTVSLHKILCAKIFCGR